MSANGSFKRGIHRLYNKASKAYFALRNDFNFYNGTSPKTIMRLFDIMIQPIALIVVKFGVVITGPNKLSNQ